MSYPGSKGQAGVFQRIIGQIPPHTVYVEPFFGSGQVFWRKRPARSSIIADLNAAAIVKAGAVAGVQAFAADALAILPGLRPALPPDAVIYCDPPLSTRNGRVYYGAREMSDQQHELLLALLQEMPCRVLVSCYPCDLYDQALADWRRMPYRTCTRGRTVTECLWLNYPQPAELHDWRFAGSNYRQRVSFKRLARRWLSKLDAMTSLQRGYVLNAIAERDQEATPDLALTPGERAPTPAPALRAVA